MEPVAQPEISVVIPLFNEEGNVAELAARTQRILEALPDRPAFELVFVDDGSTDGTLAALHRLARARSEIVVIELSRNFGHQIAATAGLDTAAGDAVILMDGDLQDPPELIPAFIERWRAGFDVVYAVRRTRRGETPFKRFTAKAFYRVIRSLTNVAIPVDTGDFRLMSRRVVDALGHTRERHRFLRGLVSWVGFRQIGVAYDRAERHTGSTKYPFSKMMRFAIDGITSFSEAPLRLSTYAGFVTSGLAFAYAALVLVLKLLHMNYPGYTSTMLAILFLGGVQLITVGILGEYVGRIYNEIKARPLYLVSGVVRGEGRSTAARAESRDAVLR